MKTVLAIFFLISTNTFSQTFEATVVWTIKAEGMSPEMAAQMEKSKKEMNDPKNQEKIKQLQEQMNSPEMKAMFEKNPQLKIQMENALKMMQGGNSSSFMPEGMVVKIKGTNSLVITKGGMAASEILTIGSKNESYSIDRSAKTFQVISKPSGTTVSKSDTAKNYTVRKTNETMKILNYDCTKYIVTSSGGNQTMNHVFWTTTGIKGFDPKAFSRQSGRTGQSFYFDGMEGFALRMEIDASKMKMVFEVTEFKRESIPASEFEIPAGFTEKKGY